MPKSNKATMKKPVKIKINLFELIHLEIEKNFFESWFPKHFQETPNFGLIESIVKLFLPWHHLHQFHF